MSSQMVYTQWETLALAMPRPNFPMEDKSHYLRTDVVHVDPIYHPPTFAGERGDGDWTLPFGNL